jgi:hypothetical protein
MTIANAMPRRFAARALSAVTPGQCQRHTIERHLPFAVAFLVALDAAVTSTPFRFLLLALGWFLAQGFLALGPAPLLAEPAVKSGEKLPPIRQPVPFDTPQADAIVSAMQIFPTDNPWNTDVSKWPLHPRSAAIVDSIGPEKPLRYNTDMSYILVPPDHKPADLEIVSYPAESDPGPYPLPDNLPIEGWPAWFRRGGADHTKLTLEDVQRDRAEIGGDRHAIVVDPHNGRLYELFGAKLTDRGWQASCAAIFDLNSNKLRPEEWTSADAAGLPIFPGVVRYDELKAGMVNHAMRVTVRNTRRAYVYPARHYASQKTDPNLPRMGERLRLKADYDLRPFSPEVQAILKGLKKYGMFVADNGIEWAISCTPDERIPVLHEELRRVKGSAFEVVEAPR